MMSERLSRVEIPTIRIRDYSPLSARRSEDPPDSKYSYVRGSRRHKSSYHRRTVSGYPELSRIPEAPVQNTDSVWHGHLDEISMQSLEPSHNHASTAQNRRSLPPVQKGHYHSQPEYENEEEHCSAIPQEGDTGPSGEDDHCRHDNLLSAPASKPLLRAKRASLFPSKYQRGHRRHSSGGLKVQQETDSTHDVSRPKSILGRLGALKSPGPRSSFNFQSSKSRKSAYLTLHDLNGDISGDSVPVDISFLEGPLDIKWNHVLNAQPSSGTMEGPYPDRCSRIGDGVVVGAELSVGPVPGGPGAVHSLKPRRESRRASLNRAATIKRYGQQLAEKNNIIVSVKESPPTIDLSSLEGTGRLGSGTSDSLLGNSTTNLVHKSYFYPPDLEQPDWKPFPMTSPYIVMLIVTSLTLAIVQEYLCQKSMSLGNEGSGLIGYNSVDDIPTVQFFCWKYLPTIVMVTYGVLWQITDYEVKRLEPYYQLSQPTGNTAAKTINLDYVTLSSYFVPYKAFMYRHWAVFVSSLGTVLATTVAPSLQNPSLAPARNPKCQDDECSGHLKFFVQIHPVWSRLVTASLVVVAALALVLFFQLRRKSGLLSDPKGIAGIASMATKSHILTDFTGMDEARHDQIHKKLQNRRYLLYKSTIWQGEYMRHAESDPYMERRVENPHPLILRRNPGIAFIVFLTVSLTLIPIITYTKVNIVVNKVPWLPILVATIIKQLWSTLEFSAKMLEPFYILSKGNARPETTLTLDYRGTPYGLLPIQAFFNGHYLVALLGLGTMMGDILTVTASSLSLNDETHRSFVASSTLSIIITAFLILSATLVLARRRHAFLPREPSTIASILAFIHQSRMLDDFVGTERFSNSEMEAMLIAKNKRYGLGWFKGRDKKPHCAVDEEPMLSRYVHGISYIRAQAPWEEDIGV